MKPGNRQATMLEKVPIPAEYFILTDKRTEQLDT